MRPTACAEPEKTSQCGRACPGQKKHHTPGRLRIAESHRKKQIRKLGRFIFVLYLLVLVYFMFLSELHDHVPGIHTAYHYNVVPFAEIRRFLRCSRQLGAFAVFTNLFGNVLGFLPLGFFLPVISPRFHHAPVTVAFGAGISLAIELTQLATRIGRYDVDDIILNTAGAALGYLLFYLANRWRWKRLAAFSDDH